jgi:hypothetical protein
MNWLSAISISLDVKLNCLITAVRNGATWQSSPLNCAIFLWNCIAFPSYMEGQTCGSQGFLLLSVLRNLLYGLMMWDDHFRSSSRDWGKTVISLFQSAILDFSGRNWYKPRGISVWDSQCPGQDPYLVPAGKVTSFRNLKKMGASHDITILFLVVVWDWVHLVLRQLFGLLYRPMMIDDDECGAVGGTIGRKNRNTRRRPAPVPLCPP